VAPDFDQIDGLIEAGLSTQGGLRRSTSAGRDRRRPDLPAAGGRAVVGIEHHLAADLLGERHHGADIALERVLTGEVREAQRARDGAVTDPDLQPMLAVVAQEVDVIACCLQCRRARIVIGEVAEAPGEAEHRIGAWRGAIAHPELGCGPDSGKEEELLAGYGQSARL